MCERILSCVIEGNTNSMIRFFFLTNRIPYRQHQATRHRTSIFQVCCSILLFRWTAGMFWNTQYWRQPIISPRATPGFALRVLFMPPCKSDCSSSRFSFSKLHWTGDLAHNAGSSTRLSLRSCPQPTRLRHGCRERSTDVRDVEY